MCIIGIVLAEPQVIDASTLPKQKREIPKTIVVQYEFGECVEGTGKRDLPSE